MALQTVIPTLLLDIGLIIITATLFNFLFRALNQPPFLAYIVSGLTLGVGFSLIPNNCLGLILENTCNGILLNGSGIGNPKDIAILSELGVAFLLFSVGIESDFLKIKKIGRMLLFGGVLQVLLSSVLVYLFLTVFLKVASLQAFWFALILSFSSTMIVVKLLADAYQIDTLHGRIMIGFLLIQDILVIILLPFASSFSPVAEVSEAVFLFFKSIFLIVLAPLFGYKFFPKLFKEIIKSPELTFLTGLSTAFAFMFFSSYFFGLPIALGAFVAGISLSTLPYNLQIYEEIRGVRDFFVTIFFVTLGINISFSFNDINLLLLLFSLFFVLIVKPIIFYLIVLFFGYGHRVALISALGLSQISEFSLILANQGLASGVLSNGLYTSSVIVLSVSMILTPYFMKHFDFLHDLSKKIVKRIPKKFKPEFFYSEINRLTQKKSDNKVIILGAGIIGSNIARVISRKTSVLCVDKNPDIVKELKRRGLNCVYANADYRSTWESLGFEKAELLVITIPNANISSKILFYVKANHPHLKVFCRAESFNDALILYHRRVDYLLIPKVLGANRFTKEIINFIEGKNIGETPLENEIVSLLEEESHMKRFSPEGKLNI